MKMMIALFAALVSVNVKASPVRQAKVTCSFLKFIDAKGTVSVNEWTNLEFNIDLETKSATLVCGNISDKCPLDGKSAKLAVTSQNSPDESFKPLVYDLGTLLGFGFGSNLSPINIEGSNGDDMDLFFRISFAAANSQELKATAVMTYADEGVDGVVSTPTPCKVN